MPSNTLTDDLLGREDDTPQSDEQALDDDTAPEPVSEPQAQDEPKHRRRLQVSVKFDRKKRQELSRDTKINVVSWKDEHHVGLRANWSKFSSGIALVVFGMLVGRAFRYTDTFGYSLGLFVGITVLVWLIGAFIVLRRAGFALPGKMVLLAVIVLLVVLGYLKIEAVNANFISAWGVFLCIVTQALLAANTLTSWWHPRKESRNIDK